MIRIPVMVPTMDPTLPKRLVPPRTTEAITSSSSPMPMLGWALHHEESRQTGGNPADGVYSYGDCSGVDAREVGCLEVVPYGINACSEGGEP